MVDTNAVDMSIQRFLGKVMFGHGPDACMLWAGAKSQNGYGQFYVGGTRRPAHRWYFEQVRGTVPEGLELDHLCRWRSCVNPWHLEPVTHQENMRRGRSHQREQAHCIHGHEFTPENTYPVDGKRQCRECGRRNSREWKKRTGYLAPHQKRARGLA